MSGLNLTTLVTTNGIIKTVIHLLLTILGLRRVENIRSCEPLIGFTVSADGPVHSMPGVKLLSLGSSGVLFYKP